MRIIITLYVLLLLPAWCVAGDVTAIQFAGWQPLGGVWRIENGELRCIQETPGWGNTLLASGGTGQDITVTATFTRIPRQGGLFLRYQGPDRWIGVTGHEGGLYLDRRTPQGQTLLQRIPEAYPTNTPFVLSVRLHGAVLCVAIDGREVANLTLPTVETGQVGLMSYGGSLRVSAIDIQGLQPGPAEVKRPFQQWGFTALDQRISATLTDDVITAKLVLTSQHAPDAPPHQVRWTLRRFADATPVAEVTTPAPDLPQFYPVTLTAALPVKGFAPGLYILTAVLATQKESGAWAGLLMPIGVTPPAPATMQWSAKTSDWRFHFTGTRANLADLARRYVEYYEPRLQDLLVAHSRELDTLLGAYATLHGQTGELRWSDRYRRLIVGMALSRMVLKDVWSDPTVQNDLMASYRFMREKEVLTAQEQQWVEDWVRGLLPELSFSMQRANYSRYAAVAAVLHDTRHDGAADALLASAPVPFATTVLGGNDSFAYDRVDWKHNLLLAEHTSPATLTERPFREVSRAYFTMWTPTGIHPGTGDDTGSSFWDPILPEWIAAHVLSNGTYKAIAIRAMQFALDHDQLRELGAQPACFSLWSHANDALLPAAPELPSAVIPTPERPEKLVLRRGWGPTDLYLLCDLWGGPGHNHDDLGAVNWLVWGGKVWMADTNYAVRASANHNLLLLDGAPAVGRATASLETTTSGKTTTETGTITMREYGRPGQVWVRQLSRVSAGDATADRLTVTDTLTASATTPVGATLHWHLRGIPERLSATTWRFTQEGVTLTVACTGGTVAVDPFEEPTQLHIGTGCPPDAYRLCWGPPYSRLTVTPAMPVPAGGTLTLTTAFTLTP
jgi:hypothetical protein